MKILPFPKSGMTPAQIKAANDDFGARLARIKASLERINELMRELKHEAKDRRDG